MILNPVIGAMPRSDATRTALLARGVALFLGAFTLLNLAGDLRVRGFDLNLWWIDLRFLPGDVADSFLFLCGLLLAWFALTRAALSKGRRRESNFLSIFLINITVTQIAGVITPALCWTRQTTGASGQCRSMPISCRITTRGQLGS